MKWTYENTLNESKKYTTRNSFRKGSPGAYLAAIKNNWLDSYTWMVSLRKTWTYESAKNEAKKYKTRGELKTNNLSLYQAALKNGWLDDYTWFVNGNKLRGDRDRKWDYNTTMEESRKYKTRTEFMKGNSSAYSIAWKNKWLDDYTWFEDRRFNIYTDKIDSVYAYEFKEQNAAYIGRTLMRTQKQRDWEHIFREDSVSSFAKSNNISIPEMKILEDNLTLKEGTEREGFWVEKYKDDGWTILNVAKTGSIGSLGKGKWNYEKTKEEAKKYKTRKEFSNGSPSAYGSALRNKWLDDYTWFLSSRELRDRKWTYDTTKAEAMKYKSKIEFSKGSPGASNAAHKNNWIKDYDWFTRPVVYNKKWTYETTKEEAKKYKSRSEFEDNNGSAYDAARKNKWLDEFFPKTK